MSIQGINATIARHAQIHQNTLTKPQGALGRLENIACWFAARQGKVLPDALQPHIVVFAGDHGVCEEGVSAYPSVVTGEMVKNFARGGAAINVLAMRCAATLSVVDVGVASNLADVEGIVHAKVRHGTANLRYCEAMTSKECHDAMHIGAMQAEKAMLAGSNVLIAGDMGIGNTTSSACIICRLTGIKPEAVVGAGTGVDAAGQQRKIQVVRDALERVANKPDAEMLQQFGGLEIAAMAGCYLQAATMGIPIVIDGFIATAAALAAQTLEPQITRWMLASHVSQENGHAAALEALGLAPMLNFSLRLGEGTGAALVVPLMQAAIALHNEMATFEDAGITDKDG